MKRTRGIRKKGFVMGIVLILITVLFILMATILKASVCDLQFATKELNTKKAFYLAESAMNIAYLEFANTNYTCHSHESNGTTPTVGSYLLTSSVPDVTRVSGGAYDGWYTWKWESGDAYSSFNNSQVPERILYKVFFPPTAGTTTWQLDAVGIYGKTTGADFTPARGAVVKRLRFTGYIDITPLFRFTYFDNRCLGEFTRGATQTITGLVHANEDMNLCPDGSSLTIKTDKLSCAGKFQRFKDLWNRPENGGHVYITKDNQSSTTRPEMGGYDFYHWSNPSDPESGRGIAFDSYNPNWTDGSIGATTKWGGTVQDSQLGAQRIDPPSIESMQEGGYYDTEAGAHITSSTSDDSDKGIEEVDFFNPQEGVLETVKQLDMSKYKDYLPANGIIYSTTPVRLVNAQSVGSPLTIVSNCNIYTKGDVNTTNPQPLALMSTSRVYHLSSKFPDWDSNYNKSNAPNASTNTTIRAAIVDGAPTVDERNYAGTSVTNPTYWTGTDQNKDGQPLCANCDDYLENFGSSRTMTKICSIVHLQNASMCDYDNSNYVPGKCRWIVKQVYNPPGRNYSYDTSLSDPNNQPPGAPQSSKRLYWVEY